MTLKETLEVLERKENWGDYVVGRVYVPMRLRHPVQRLAHSAVRVLPVRLMLGKGGWSD